MDEFKPVLKNKNFLYIWASQILSQLTINMMNFLLLVRLFEITGSSIATSLLWVAYSLPALLVGPFASTVVDVVDRRKVLVLTNFLQAMTIFVYSLSHQFSVFLVYGVVLIYSLLNQFYVPAESATLPSVIKKNHLPFGNGLFFLTQQGAIILGFSLAGLLNNFLPFTLSLYVCSFLVFLAFVSTLMLPHMAKIDNTTLNFENTVVSFVEKIIEGYKFIKERKRVLAPLVLLIGVQVIVQVIIISVPSIAKDILVIPLNSSSIFVVIPASLGSIIAAIVIPKLLGRGIRKKAIIVTSLQTAVAMFFFITFVISLISSPLRSYLGFFAIMLIGASFVGITIPSNTFLQESTPHELRGRVFGSFWFLVTVASMFPVIFSGTVIEILGIRFLLFVLTGVTFLVLIFSRRFDLTKYEK